jgi:hypothetical protein
MLVVGMINLSLNLKKFNFMKSYNDKVATVSAIIAIIAIIVSIVTPEIRNFFLGNNTDIPVKNLKDYSTDSVNQIVQSLLPNQKDTVVIYRENPIESQTKSKLSEPDDSNSDETTFTKFENVTYNGKAGTLEGEITFYNTNKNIMEFAGVLSIFSVNGKIKKGRKKLTIIESDNCKGEFTLLENDNKIIGTAIILKSYGEEPLSIDLRKKID